MLWPPIFGQKSVQWPEVFEHIKRYDSLWETWKCSKTLDKMTLNELGNCWNIGEDACNGGGEVTGRKPPLRLIEQHFGSKWHSGSTVISLASLMTQFLMCLTGSQVVGTD